ncbi:MAG: glycoside hydrolase family 25 protein [Spirochaetia bacterium]|nr:glycoside hydrolase family 25 protein [Spirochaetia bacterium]
MNLNMRWWIIAFATVSLSFLCGCLVWAVMAGKISINSPSADAFPVRGIDVSRYQGQIDWTRVKKAGIRFAYMKATEGGDYRDPLFAQNWLGTEHVGIPHGAYHFFTLCKSGKIQAENFIKTVPLETRMLPPVLDLEFTGTCEQGPAIADVKSEVNDYLELVEQWGGQRVILYITYDFYSTHLAPDYTDHPIWIRDIIFSPRKPFKDTFTIWQFSNLGRVNGIGSAVDLNVFNGSEQEFEQWLSIRKKQ